MDRFKTLLTERTSDYDIWIGLDTQPVFSNNNYLVEAFLKLTGGIHHLVRRYEKKPSIKQILSDAKKAIFSKRPYTPGQACDGSITTSVLALFKNFCDYFSLNPTKLYQQAYPTDEPISIDQYKQVVEFAQWQGGVEYPTTWDKTAIFGLIESLREINYHSLNELVIEYLDNGSFWS
ncbi:hypothetical protein [Gloeothece verrucosa]|uniref:Uncharacterized protein n=1 Tax=Gloeothece verrucosa (strain PCC 7822) TaxID=497965 RepID=E0UN36_GLOV7|nr:hypothetical protein [Gloeothece verrucosa]ADN18366.1 hypothetical protein Cyan7822_6614 [Gloeothece verrucosa PCC 7822]